MTNVNTDYTFSGVGNISGSIGLTKSGSGSLTIGTANDFTGSISVNAGVLRAINNTALGSTAATVSVTNGAALELAGGIAVGAEPLLLAGTGISSGGALRNVSDDNTYGGPIILTGAARINSDAGTLMLDVASGNGIAGAFNLAIGGAGNVTVADPIATGAGALTKDGTGTLTFTGANSYSGGDHDQQRHPPGGQRRNDRDAGHGRGDELWHTEFLPQ